MSSIPAKFRALEDALQLADLKERERAVLRECKRLLKASKPPQPRTPPGPKLSKKETKQATFAVLRRFFPTDNGIGCIPLLKLTPEELAVLPVDVWKRTMEGRGAFADKGEEGLKCYVTEQKPIYKTWKELHQIKEMYILVEKEMGLIPRNGREKPRGGKFRLWVREAQEEFFLAHYGLTYESIPPNLRPKGCTPEEFEQKQKEYQFKHCSNG